MMTTSTTSAMNTSPLTHNTDRPPLTARLSTETGLSESEADAIVHGLEDSFATRPKTKEQILKEERRKSWRDVCTKEMVDEAGLSEDEAVEVVEALQGVVEGAFEASGSPKRTEH